MKARWMLAALFALSVVTYLDRACISSAKGRIAADLGLSDAAMGLVFGAFSLGYALAQMPAGWLADRYGARALLAGAVALWSAATALTGAAQGLAAMLGIRLLFGVFEAAAFPGAAKVIAARLAVDKRGLANGILFSGSRLGAAVSFPVFAAMLEALGWRWSFAGLSLLGFAWAGAWWVWFRDAPRAVGQRAAGEAFDWKAVRGPAALACLQYFASNFTFFLCLTWMFSYLQGRYGLSAREAAVYSAIPLVAGAASQWLSGMAVDRMYRVAPEWSRRGPAAAGFVLAAAGLLGLPAAATPLGACVLFACAAFGADSTISPSWTFCQDVGGACTGRLSGAMNMVGNFGALASASLFPLLKGADGQPGPYFIAAALLNTAAAAAWMAMKSRRSPGAVPRQA